MSASTFPVFVETKKADGTLERVRVGSAVRSEDGFVLRLGELVVGSTAETAAPVAARRAAAPSGGGDGMLFPPYGRSKSQPIAGATMQDLEYYAGGCRRTLGDPSKSRWHDKERVLLAAIEAEMARQGGGGAPAPAPSMGMRGSEEPPPLSDDDIPF